MGLGLRLPCQRRNPQPEKFKVFKKQLRLSPNNVKRRFALIENQGEGFLKKFLGRGVVKNFKALGFY